MRSPLVLAVAAALAGTAAADSLHVFEPDGWVADPTAESAIAGLRGARVFHPPGDPTSSLIAGEARFPPGDPASVVTSMLDQLAVDARRVESRTVRTADGRTIGEIALVDKAGVPMRARVAAALHLRLDNVEMAIGVCRGPAVAVCAPKLAWINVVARPADDDSSMWRIPLIIFGVAVGLGLAAGVTRRWWRARAVAGSGALRDHERVTITGIVRPVDQPIAAPLTGRSCVMYRARARVFTRDAVPTALGEPVEIGCVPFVITTNHGEVVVDASPALDAATSAIVERSREREVAFLARHGFAGDRHAGTVFDELVIEPGATIKIRGVVLLERDAHATDERGYRDDAPTVVKLVAVEGTPLALLDTW